MMAPPGDNAVTSPVALTVATPSLLLVQVTGRPVNNVPLRSRTCALNWKLSSTSSALLPGTICRVATGMAVTVICAKPLRPLVLAATCTVPSLRAVTTPNSETVAILSSSDAQ